MRLDDGIVRICSLENTADPGFMPNRRLNVKAEQYFEERVISQNRQYLAKGVSEQVDMVIRIWDDGTRPRIGMYAVLTNYEGQESVDGDQFRIDNVQPLMNDEGLRVFDLTLSRMEDRYDVDAG